MEKGAERAGKVPPILFPVPSSASDELAVSIVRVRAGQVRIAFLGELVASTQEQVLSAVTAALNADATAVLELDLAGVGFLDARGLTALVKARTLAECQGCRAVLLHPRPWIARVLRAGGLLPH
jgi:anti-anti-sigma factor